MSRSCELSRSAYGEQLLRSISAREMGKYLGPFLASLLSGASLCLKWFCIDMPYLSSSLVLYSELLRVVLISYFHRLPLDTDLVSLRSCNT